MFIARNAAFPPLSFANTVSVFTRQQFAWCWLVAQVIALWPTWVWMSKRMTDGSDDPLGTLALGMLGITIWQMRHHLANMPKLTYLVAGLGLTLVATIMLGQLPALIIGIFSMTALTATLLAVLPPQIAKLPLLGLSILALPILSSLQFYAGYPLRVVTAEVSSWILFLFYDVQREGSTLLVNNKMIIVDAPCSGVQMVWLGYFTAFTIALWQRLTDKQLLMRLPFIGAIILIGNILRNSILVAIQASDHSLAQWLHEIIGLVALGSVCITIATVILSARTSSSSQEQDEKTHIKKQSNPARSFLYTGVIFFLLCSFWSIHQASAKAIDVNSNRPFVEWPYQWGNKPLRPLALSDVEARFSENFPGAIARMTDEKRVFVFRHITSPTRKLHPAADCYKGLGYAIHNEVLQQDTNQVLWRCFIATRSGKSIQVCEHIEDKAGQSYTDTSAWYWSALLTPNAGPWMAVTIAQAVEEGNNEAIAIITE